MQNANRTRSALGPLLALALVVALSASGAAQASGGRSFLNSLSQVTALVSTVPSNGDINPYGVAVAPVTTGALQQGNILVSNFNNSLNQQGTGSTIVQITPAGAVSLFTEISATPAGCGGVGLTTALVALHSGFVIVGSLPTTAGDPTTSQAGCLIVLDSNGNVVETFSGNGINGPWDMTAVEFGETAVLFVTNVLNGTVAGTSANVSSTPPSPLVVVNGGTVLRLVLKIEPGGNPQLLQSTVIASGFPERLDSAALVIGPTGVAFDAQRGILYVADTLNSRITAIPNALRRMKSGGTGRTVSQGGALNGPLGLTRAPNGNLIAANSGDGNLVEVAAPSGRQVATKLGESAGAGSLFGLAAVPGKVYFVDDATNFLNVAQ